MTPADIIAWSLALALAWVLLAMCIPIERWIELHMQRRVRHKGMEQRLEELERRFREQSPPEA